MSISPNYFFYADISYVDTSNTLINFSNLTGNAELNEHPLSKYARGIFFSPNYNKQFFDAINWANNLGDYKTQLNLINPFNNSILQNLFDNSIPSAYPEGIIAYYVASDVIIENNSWPDRSGNNNATLVGTGFSTSTDGLALQGTTSSSILFGNILNTEYTICSITSYSGTNNKTILNSANTNWIHGHYNGRSGVIAYELDGDIHPPAPPSITLVGSIDTPSQIGVDKSWGAAPELFNANTTATWDGLKPDKDWSIVVKTDARVKFIMRWGPNDNSWANESMYISDNYGWNAGAPGHVTFYWKNVIAISVMGIPGDESARAHINSISFAVSYDSALYQSDPANVTSITTGPQNENAAIKLYIIIGNGEWVLANISHVYHYGTPVDSRPSPPGYFRGPYTSSSYYGHAYGTASQIDEAELYNGIWTPPAPSTSSTSSTSSTPTESFWTVTCGTNAIASDGTQSILVNGNNITPVLEQEFPYNDYVYKIDNTIEGISINVPGSQLGGWAGSLEKDFGIYFKFETDHTGWQGNIFGLHTDYPNNNKPRMNSWIQGNDLYFAIKDLNASIHTYVPFTISPSTIYEIYITWHAMLSSHPTAPDLNDIVIGFRESGGNWINSTGSDGHWEHDDIELSNNENFSVENNVATTVLGINGNGDINSNGGNPGNKIIDFRLYNKYLDHNESAPASVYGSDGNISVNINNGNSSDFSDFAIKELIVWSRALTTDEMKSVSDYMIANLNSPVFNVPPTLPPTGFVEVNGATWSQGRLQGFGYSIGSFGQGDTVQGVQFKTELGTDTMIGLTYSVPISDPVGGWAQGGYMIYPHQVNTIYAYDGPTSKGAHSTLDNNTQIWQIRVNINSRVELVKNGTIFYTFDSPSATAWSGGTQLYVVITWKPSNTYDWQWINASGEPVGDIWI